MNQPINDVGTAFPTPVVYLPNGQIQSGSFVQPMTLLQNEVEAIHNAKKATKAILDDVAYAEVESAIDDLIKVIGRLQSRSIDCNRRINMK
jgi:hypothetical protein